MLRGCSSCTKRAVLKIFFAILLVLLSSPTIAGLKKKPAWPFDKTKVTLKDGRSLLLQREKEEYTWKLSLFDKKHRVLWSKIYSEDFNSLWGDAFFVRVKRKTFIYDLNNDGYPEIAISTWDGGNAPLRPAIVFTVKEKELTVFKVVDEYAFESGDPVFD